MKWYNNTLFALDKYELSLHQDFSRRFSLNDE